MRNNCADQLYSGRLVLRASTAQEATARLSHRTCIIRNCGRHQVIGNSQCFPHYIIQSDTIGLSLTSHMHLSYSENMFKVDVEKETFALKVSETLCLLMMVKIYQSLIALNFSP